jgi:thiol:disulfide interchange protein DsbD
MIILGLATGAGVVAIWLLGGVLVSLAVISALSQLVSYWWFNLAIALVILLMGLGMFGLFQAGLPQWVYNLNPKHESVGGSFAYGMLHAVFSIPCVAPLGGAAIAWAATQQPGVTLLVFTAVGVGMAVPYILLSVFPSLLKVIPKAGPASDLLKQVMGMMMIAAGLFFLGTALISLVKTHPYIAYTLHWWAAGIVLVITGLWLAGRIVIVARGPWTKVILGALGLALAAGGVLLAIGETRDRREAYDAEVLAAKSSAGQSKRGAYDPGHLWQPYSPEAYDAAIRDGRVVVLDFTAEWCFNCKALEKAVLRRDDVRAALTRPNVVTFKADLTARNAPGWDRLAALGRNGIPLIAISGPGLTTPFLSEAYTPAQVIDNTTAALGPAK